MQHAPTQNNSGIQSLNVGLFRNNVKVVDRSYLNKVCPYINNFTKELVNQTSREFSLNAKQECAFRTIANHAITTNTDQLKMYIGGMASTGKSQVFKVLLHFFNKRNESHRFMALAAMEWQLHC